MVLGKIVVFDLKLTQSLKTRSKFWKLTQFFGEQFQGIEVVVKSKIADTLAAPREFSIFSKVFNFFRGVWAKLEIPPLRSVMFAIQQFFLSLNERWGTIFLHKWPVFIIILVIWWVSHGSSSMTGSGIMFREHAMLKNYYSARCNTMIDTALTNLVTRIHVTTQGHRKL